MLYLEELYSSTDILRLVAITAPETKTNLTSKPLLKLNSQQRTTPIRLNIFNNFKGICNKSMSNKKLARSNL